MRWFSLTRSLHRWSPVRHFAVRSAVVFILVGLVLHFLVVQLVEEQFHSHAEFHAVFVTEAVLAPTLADAELSGGASREERLAVAEQLRSYATELDDAVYHVVVWDEDGRALAADEPAFLDERPAGYPSSITQAARGAFSPDRSRRPGARPDADRWARRDRARRRPRTDRRDRETTDVPDVPLRDRRSRRYPVIPDIWPCVVRRGDWDT